MKSRIAKTAIAIAAILAATGAWAADSCWNNTAEGVKYFDDSANWLNFGIGNWVFNSRELSRTPVEVTFTNFYSIGTGMWFENSRTGTISFKATDDAFGLNMTTGNGHLGTNNDGAAGSLRIEGGTHHFANDLLVGDSANSYGVIA